MTKLSTSEKNTARINEQVTLQNAAEYEATEDKLAFCSDCLGASLHSDSGYNLSLRLEDELIALN